MATAVQQGTNRFGFDAMKDVWAWFVGLGVLQIVLGAIALGASVVTTLVSVALIGWLLIIAGVLSAVHAFWRKGWTGFLGELVMGILYAVAGFMFVANPAETAVALTLLIVLMLLIGGVFRIVMALSMHLPHRIWIFLNGVISLVLGIMIWKQWPSSGLWVIGMFIGIDLIFYGWSLVMLGLAAKSLMRVATR